MSDKIKIEKNIIMPCSHKASCWPFLDMKVGDSFLVPESLMGKVSSAMIYFGKSNKMKFSKMGNRVWRIK